jgi:hypothetical protein
MNVPFEMMRSTDEGIMAATVRTFLKLIIGFFASWQGAAISDAQQVRPDAPARSETLTVPAFFARVRQDAALRARFSRNPRAVLREHGIDPAPFDVPDRLNEAQLERLLSDWGGGSGGSQAAPAPQPAPSPTTPVYGPPPGLRRP